MRGILLLAVVCLLVSSTAAEATEDFEAAINGRLAGIIEPINELLAEKQAVEAQTSEEEEEEAMALIEEQAIVSEAQDGLSRSLAAEVEQAISQAMTEDAPSAALIEEDSEAEEGEEQTESEEQQLDEDAERESNIEAQEQEAEAETVVQGQVAEEDEEQVTMSAPSEAQDSEAEEQSAVAEQEEEQELNSAEQEEQNEQEETFAVSDEQSEQLDEQAQAEAENALIEAEARPSTAERAKLVTKDEYRQIKEATAHYVKAVQTYLDKAYGGNALTIRKNGITILVNLYRICKKYTGNRFLCGQIRDKYLKRFMTKDILDDAVARKFGAMVFRTILDFAIYIKKNPEEFSGRFVNEKLIKDFFNVEPDQQGVAARRFVRALAYEIKTVYPDLPHQVVTEWTNVLVAANQKCNLIQRKLFFPHDVCTPMNTLLRKKFATKDVFTTKSVRKEFIRALLRISLKVWKKEHPKWQPKAVGAAATSSAATKAAVKAGATPVAAAAAAQAAAKATKSGATPAVAAAAAAAAATKAGATPAAAAAVAAATKAAAAKTVPPAKAGTPATKPAATPAPKTETKVDPKAIRPLIDKKTGQQLVSREGLPIYVDGKGDHVPLKTIKDKTGKPVVDSKTGKPLLVTASGKPLGSVKALVDKKTGKPVLDSKGKPIIMPTTVKSVAVKPAIDAKGKPMKDSKGKPIFVSAKTGKPIIGAKPLLDSKGQPVVNAKGKPIFVVNKSKKQIKKEEKKAAKVAAAKAAALKTPAKKPEGKKVEVKKVAAAPPKKEKKDKKQTNVVHQRYKAAIPHDRMVITIRLALSFDVVAGHNTDLTQFIKTFNNDVARALVIASNRIVVLSVSRGADNKVVVKFAIEHNKENKAIHSNPESADSVDALASKFVHETQDSHSLLYNSPILSKIDSLAEVVVAKELGSGDPTAFVELANQQAEFIELGRSSGSFIQPALFTLLAAVLAALLL